MKQCDVCQANVPDKEYVDRGDWGVCHQCIDNAFPEGDDDDGDIIDVDAEEIDDENG